jgi:HlyD family secretion protein
MQIDTNFAEADVGNIRVGQTVRFTVDAFADRHFQGKVRQIRLNPTVVSNVVTYDVVIDVDNPGQILLPGMTAYVNITVAERKDVLLVPNAALRFKPANAEMQKPAANQTNTVQQSGVSPVGAKPKRDAFTGKVYVLENGKPKPVSVSLGITDNRNTEITGGELKAGDQTVVGELQAADQSTSSGSRPPLRMF